MSQGRKGDKEGRKEKKGAISEYGRGRKAIRVEQN